MSFFIPVAKANPASNTNLSSGNIIDPYAIATSKNGPSNPELFKLYLAASMTNVDALFGDNDNDNSSDAYSTLFPTQQTANSTFSPAATVYEEMITRSNLIGKTVDAFDPESKKIVTGKVSGVTVESGKLLIIVNGKGLSPENLVTIKE